MLRLAKVRSKGNRDALEPFIPRFLVGIGIHVLRGRLARVWVSLRAKSWLRSRPVVPMQRDIGC
jgi:hypothetical protein